MEFDAASAKPITADTAVASPTQGFDPSTARPYDPETVDSFSGQKFNAPPPVEDRIPKQTVKAPAKPPPEPGFLDRLGKVAETTGYGTILGGFTPELTMAGGTALMLSPYTAPIGSELLTAGRAMRAGSLSSRVPMAVQGGTAALGGETLKQTGEVFGASEPTKMGLELAGQMTGTGITQLVAGAFGKMVGLGKAEITSLITRLGSSASEQGLINETQRERANQVAKEIKGNATESDIQKLYNIIFGGAKEIEAKGQAAFSQAEAEASRLAQLAEKSGKAEDWQKVVPQLKSVVGQPRELSEIGTALRDPIVKNNQAALAKRSADYKTLETARDKVLADKEAAGEFIENSADYKTLVKELNEVLKPQGRAAKETDPGVRKAFEDLLAALTPQKQTLSDAEAKAAIEKGFKVLKATKPSVEIINGVPTQIQKEYLYRELPPSFNAIDTVRRRLGDAAFGKEAEGYAALKGNLAQDWYFKLSKMQENFAGESQKALQNTYKEHSGWLDKYKAQLGKKVTALDRFDETKFAADAKTLPDQFFQSQQSVRDLLQLTGDKAAVNKAASDYTARSIGDTVKEAQAFKSKHSEMLKELPEVGRKVDSYIQQLQRGELAVAKGEAQKVQFGEKAKSILQKGKEELTASEQEVQKILKDQFPVDRVKNLLTSGSVEEWGRIAPIIAKDPQGKEIFAKALSAALGQETSGLVLTRPGTIGAVFEDKIAPAIRSAKLMDEQKIALIKRQLENLYASPKTAQAKLSGAQKLIINSIIPGTVAGGLTYGTDKIFGLNQTGM
jgi:hypothetical protein